MTETQKLDAWYAEKTSNGEVRDIKFSLSASGRGATVEALAREANITIQLSQQNEFTSFNSALDLDMFLRENR